MEEKGHVGHPTVWVKLIVVAVCSLVARAWTYFAATY